VLPGADAGRFAAIRSRVQGTLHRRRRRTYPFFYSFVTHETRNTAAGDAAIKTTITHTHSTTHTNSLCGGLDALLRANKLC